jgi:hypothetical protein
MSRNKADSFSLVFYLVITQIIVTTIGVTFDVVKVFERSNCPDATNLPTTVKT